MKKNVFVFDTEILGKEKPIFLTCCKNINTQERFSFWADKRKQVADLTDLLLDDRNTFVSFNGNKFDAPLLSMLLWGHDVHTIKHMAQRIIEERLQPWEACTLAGIKLIDFDHIDLIEVAPGVMTSLKTYAGRMFYPSMIDLPFHHDKDLTPKEKKIVENYCFNDLGVTEALLHQLKEQIELRVELSMEHGLDLRSKSDAQMAEAILKKKVGIGPSKKVIPQFVTYTAPAFIKPRTTVLKTLLDDIEHEQFLIDKKTGSPQLPAWLEKSPVTLGSGVYQVGIGGLHSKHDKQFFIEATDDYLVSDFDVASYYPSIILKCGLIPKLGSGKGDKFIEAYREIFEQRLEAKRVGDKATANSLKITLNGTYGKLGSIYSAFYSPDLLLAVTLTGQLNLLCLIEALVAIKGVSVLSANTDGLMVGYAPALRDKVLDVFAKNSKRTDFEYEETKYAKVAMKDVNNYIAITTSGKSKAKGLYAPTGLQKNPTMPVCSAAATKYLLDGTKPSTFIKRHKRFVDFTAIRNVKGGGEQNGVELGRVARWYMTTETLPPIRYVSNGNKVPKTEGARACLILPDETPTDLNREWYIAETLEMLNDMGVKL